MYKRVIAAIMSGERAHFRTGAIAERSQRSDTKLGGLERGQETGSWLDLEVGVVGTGGLDEMVAESFLMAVRR